MSNLLDVLPRASLPSTDLEEWRYSRVADIDPDAYHWAPPADDAPPPGLLAARDVIVDRAATVLIRNGRMVGHDVSDEAVRAGVRVGRTAELPELAPRAGSLVASPDAFTAVHAQLPDGVADVVVVDVPAGVVLDAPIVVASWIDHDGAAVAPHLVVRAGEQSQVRVVEWIGSDDVAALTIPLVELEAERGARLAHVSVQDLGRSVHQVARLVSVAGQEATVSVAHAALGGDYARVRFDCRLEGRGATGDLATLYFGSGEQMHDLRTFQEHLAPDSTSDLLFKGAVDDHARAVYTGLIRIGKLGRGAVADQTNRIIKLSPDAWAESVPNLEIEHNDVRCSHASAVGPIDAEQRFYLESRGVPPDATERLVVNGFFEEVVESFGPPAAQARLRSLVASKLGLGR